MMNMGLCGLSTGLSTESAQSTESRESRDSPSPTASEVSQWCPWGHPGYCLTNTEDTTRVPAVTQSMNLTRDLSDILNRVLHIESSILNRILLVRSMESAHVDADVVYVNHRGQDSSEEFEYRDGNNSPPPLSQ